MKCLKFICNYIKKGYLGVNLLKDVQVLYTKNYKTSLK